MFLAMKSCVCKALIDINSDLQFPDNEMTVFLRQTAFNQGNCRKSLLPKTEFSKTVLSNALDDSLIKRIK
jgi:hypothetical protein